MANSPTITRIGAMPDSRSGLSKVNRVSPVTGSVPTVEIIRPRMPAISPFTSDSRESDAITLNPSTPSAKYACGVNASATVESRSAQQHQHAEAKQAADKPRVERDAERLAGPSLQLHGVAVGDGGGGGIGARRANQDGGNRAAVFRAHIGGREHDDRHRRIQRVGQRQQQRHRDRRRDARQRAAQDAPRNARTGRGHDRT